MKWDQCFLDVLHSLFRITAISSKGERHGTGFVVAQYKEPEKIKYALATAHHLFKHLPADENIHWFLEKYNWKGQKINELTFKSNLEVSGYSPIRVHENFDLAVLFLPNEKLDGVKIVRTINPSYAIQPGTRVGWAGFPKIAKQKTNSPHPCYFEGVLSAVIEKQDRLFYLVDGHGGDGVSGGPLWYWNENAQDYEIIGICSQYIKSADLGAPGLVVFESINPLLRYLTTSEYLEMNIIT